MITPEAIAGWSALVAAVATVVGAALLMLFFSRGQPWGTLNDIASIILMLATVPVALVIGAILEERVTTLAWVHAGVGVLGMSIATGAQAALVARRRTYQQLLPWTLGGGAIVGLWYLGVAALTWTGPLAMPLPALAVGSGLGFIAIGYGFLVGNERHPASVVGGIVLLLASTAFLLGLAWTLLTGAIRIGQGNV